MSLNRKYMTDGALLVGSVVKIADIVNGTQLGVMPENTERFRALAKRYRIRSHQDGWFVDGKGHKSQIWEYGVAKLGLTVTGPKFVLKAYRIGGWLKPRGLGDREANFHCDWTDENLARLTSLVGLQKRKTALPSARSERINEDCSDE